MAKFQGFNAAQLLVVTATYRESRRLLERAVGLAGSKQWRDVFGRVMGSAGDKKLKKAEQNLEEIVKTMHLRTQGKFVLPAWSSRW